MYIKAKILALFSLVVLFFVFFPKNALAASASRIMIAGDNTTINGQPYTQINYLNPDGTIISSINNLVVNSPKISPDGTKVLFYAPSANSNCSSRSQYQESDIFTMNIDGTNIENLTPPQSSTCTNNYWPSWSPDGTKIVFTRSSDMYTMNADGSSLTNLGIYGIDPKWSPDGTKIAFLNNPGSIGYTLYTINPDGSGYANLGITGGIQDFTWSPNGTKIAYFGFQQNTINSLITINADGSNPNTLFYGFELRGAADWIAWSPDGSTIAFSGAVQNLTTSVDTYGLFTIPVMGGTPTEIYDFNGNSAYATNTYVDWGNIQTNVNPVIGTISASINPVQVNTATSLQALFTDSNTPDTHTASWDWGDNTTPTQGTITEQNGSNPGTIGPDSHIYTSAGVYPVILTVKDNNGGSATKIYQYISVFDPTPQGLFSAGQRYTSPMGADIQNQNITGPVTFGLSYKYQGTVPTGNRQFSMDFNNGNLHFNATTINTLVISNGVGTLTGTGTLNGNTGYNFLVTGSENDNSIRIQISDSIGNVIYDTQPGAAATAASTIAVNAGKVLAH